MSENQFHYGTGFTSVRTHAPPGGSSNFSLGWTDEPQQAPAKPVQQAPTPVAPTEPENLPPKEEEEE